MRIPSVKSILGLLLAVPLVANAFPTESTDLVKRSEKYVDEDGEFKLAFQNPAFYLKHPKYKDGKIVEGKYNSMPNPFYVVSTKLHFSDKHATSDITDGQLATIAKKAFVEMASRLFVPSVTGKTLLSAKKVPSAIAALKVNDEIIIAASVKGNTPTLRFTYQWGKKYLETTEWNTILTEQFNEDECVHGNDGACGEMLATYLWYFQHGDKKISDASPAPRIVTVINNGKWTPSTDFNGDSVKIHNACNEMTNNKKQPGCEQFMSALGVTAIDNTVAFEDIDVQDGRIKGYSYKAKSFEHKDIEIIASEVKS
ncbi:hypothetical protein K490DRAFT_61492 [Saccharata proteae CBS 121410]|uniref:Uncharacterized protein n=1 Tax=Saccharata proteae CBS 121410 TaxID=1314787 RepID=A0A9P4I2L6_9PEZI|nr:hypothetical protein K490DRAFT_61492 [Saccharata proteae CBS 121410]